MRRKTGWRGIIYDGDWARFKQGQKGIIVSEDGKTCETSDNDKSRIVIIAEKNPSYKKGGERFGHVLFRQKGSDLYDIVCIMQNPSKHTYILHVNNIDLNRCDKWNSFKEKLKNNVYFENEEGTITYPSKYNIISPVKSDFNNLQVGVLPISITAVEEGKEYSASSTCYVADDEWKYSDTEFTINIKNSDILKIKEGRYNYDILSNPDSIDCNGGEVKFTVKLADYFISPTPEIIDCNGGNVLFEVKGGIEYSIYEIDVTGITAVNVFKKCGEPDRRETSTNVMIECISTYAEIIESSSNKIKVKVDPAEPNIVIKVIETEYNAESDNTTITFQN
jgi:hypothetical protein